MSLVRMFHYDCDSRLAGYECVDSQGDEWYASVAKSQALAEGWHIKGNKSICPECWDRGARFKDLDH